MQAVNGSKYKWMLYGDDDTLWFTGGVLDLLKDLDPDMPYVITGTTQSVALCCAVYAVLGWTGLCCDILHCAVVRCPALFVLCCARCAMTCFDVLSCSVLCCALALLPHLVLRCAALSLIGLAHVLKALLCCR